MADRHSGPKNGGSSLPIAKYKSCPVHLHAHLVDSLRPATAVANLIRNLILLESEAVGLSGLTGYVSEW